ncbi:MAG: hypothetical protein U9Q70_03170 [Chloroflexota bacterium]|nr:hypothetical protein [Chloroflexota bacterium]
MGLLVSDIMRPLIKRKIFATKEDAVRSLLREYILRQIETLQEELTWFEQQHGMRFEQFTAYVHERSLLLGAGELTLECRQELGQAVMQEEDDWLDWKVAQEMLESWLGLRQETVE